MTTKWTHSLGSLWCKTALLAMGLAATTAGGATFESAIADATWHLEVSPFECRLWQDIPLYGAAVFSRRAGEEPLFYLQQENRQLAPGEAKVVAQRSEERRVGKGWRRRWS